MLRYLASTVDMGITYGAGASGLMGWVDADCAGDPAARKSRTGFVFVLHGGAVDWGSRLQDVTATSTAESKYMAGSTAAKEGVWLRRMCSDVEVATEGAVHLLGDNQTALAMAAHNAVAAHNADSPQD